MANLPKLNFFGWVSTFDGDGKMNRHTAVCSTIVKATDSYVALTLSTFPDGKFAEVGFDLNAWETIQSIVKEKLRSKKDVDHQ